MGMGSIFDGKPLRGQPWVMKPRIPEATALRDVSRYRLSFAGPGRHPPLEGCFAFATTPTGQQARDADVLVKIRPLDGIPIAQQLPVGAFSVGSVDKPLVPGQRNRQGSSIRENKRQGLSGHAQIRN